MSKPNRNDPCPCGSGKKFKKCCESKGKLQNIEVQTSRNLLQEKTLSLFKKRTSIEEKN